ncbi:uncharacterized protein LOC111791910 isoform X2 [Cucurbita pepo subsp. pepo]|nr:uncharacterized protein LOC111791910 isoform X2 [Cucurbita pepo subsp. pepo]
MEIHRVGTFGLCNRPSPLLADIVLFELSLMGFPTRFLNTFARAHAHVKGIARVDGHRRRLKTIPCKSGTQRRVHHFTPPARKIRSKQNSYTRPSEYAELPNGSHDPPPNNPEKALSI